MNFFLPLPVVRALETLRARGYAAYVVGGCVRDMVRGATPHDYDICTSALPSQTKACFADQRVIETGLQHGTVTVILDEMLLEITTFRTDGAYLDGRHPQSVAFTDALNEDLQRRDFTINAMAYHPAEGLIDRFGGQRDCKQGCVRCVGDPAVRFTEDALRMLRALRFAACLGFTIAPETSQALHALKGRLQLISRERIAAELLRTLNVKGGAAVFSAYADVVLQALPQAQSGWETGLRALQALPENDTSLRLAALLHGCKTADAASALSSLKLSKQLQTQVLALLCALQAPMQPMALYWAQLGYAQAMRLTALMQAVNRIDEARLACLQAELSAVRQAKLPASADELALNGHDLSAMGFRGADIGRAKRGLYQAVLLGKVSNEPQALRAYLTSGSFRSSDWQ